MDKADVELLPDDVTEFIRTGRPWELPPAGWDEKNAIHMGNGIWTIRYQRLTRRPTEQEEGDRE